MKDFNSILSGAIKSMKPKQPPVLALMRNHVPCLAEGVTFKAEVVRYTEQVYVDAIELTGINNPSWGFRQFGFFLQELMDGPDRFSVLDMEAGRLNTEEMHSIFYRQKVIAFLRRDVYEEWNDDGVSVDPESRRLIRPDHFGGDGFARHPLYGVKFKLVDPGITNYKVCLKGDLEVMEKLIAPFLTVPIDPT